MMKFVTFVIVPLLRISKMFLYIILICLTTCHAQGYSSGEDSLEDWASEAEASEPGKRIVGGTDAKEGEIPYQVSFRLKDGRHFCGGSIIDPHWILTAAHCVANLKPSDFYIVVGSVKLNEGGSKYNVDKIFINKNFNYKKKQFDLALVKTTSPIEYMQPNIQNIYLATEETPAGTKCLVSGWGRLSKEGVQPNQLQKVELYAISLDSCKKAYARNQKNTPIVGSQICAYTAKGKGTCQGDSGGPLVCDKKLVGIVSYSVPCAVGYPSVFTKAFSFTKWIMSTMKEN